MKKLVLIVLLFSTPAWAEPSTEAKDKPLAPTATDTADKPAAQPAPAPTPPSAYFIMVDQNDLNLLSAAINELPKKLADPLIQRLQSQIQDQAKVIAKAVEQKK